MDPRTPAMELTDETVADGCWSLPDGRVVMLPASERRVMRALWLAKGAAVSRKKLVEEMVGDEPEGGALSIASSLTRMLRKLRERVEPLGYLIASQRQEGARLVKAPAVEGAYGTGDGQKVMR